MSRKIFFVVSILVILVMVVAGCSTGPYGRRSASLDSSDGQSKYADNYVGFFMPTIGPEELANAELTQAMAEQVRKGQAGDLAGKYIGVLINQDESRTVTLYHPSQGTQIQIPPGRHSFVYSTDIPKYFNVRWVGDNDLDRVRVEKKTKVYNGVNCDFGKRVWYIE